MIVWRYNFIKHTKTEEEKMETPMLLLKNNNGINVESNIFLLESPLIKIGRDSSADLRIPDQFISRLHAEIYSEGGKWFIRDNKSKNGTCVNNNKIGADPVQLKQGDVISFSQKIEYIYRDHEDDSDSTRTISVSLSPYGVEINEKSEEVIVDGIKISPRLGQQEFMFLSLLAEEPDRIHTYKELAKKIYLIDEDIFALDEYKKQLYIIKGGIAKKFNKQGITREVIKSRSGVGYQLAEKEAEK